MTRMPEPHIEVTKAYEELSVGEIREIDKGFWRINTWVVKTKEKEIIEVDTCDTAQIISQIINNRKEAELKWMKIY